MVIVAVNEPWLASGAPGQKTAVELAQITVPWTGTAAAPEVSVNVVAVSVAGSIASLKVALTVPLRETSVAPLRGCWKGPLAFASGGDLVETKEAIIHLD